MIGSLPETLLIGKEPYNVRSDYRDVLQVFEAFSAPDLTQSEKWIVAIKLLIEPFSCVDDVFRAVDNGFEIKQAIDQIIWFINAGNTLSDKDKLPVYDWVHDEQIIFSAINDKAKCSEVREVEYLHWWTFLGYFNEIDRDSMFSFIMNIRNKRNKGKKLEKHEQEFYDKNKELVEIETPISKEEREVKEKYEAMADRILRK